MDAPDALTITQISDDEGIRWRVCGLGYCTEHSQLWQAEVIHHCLRLSKGIDPEYGTSPFS